MCGGRDLFGQRAELLDAEDAVELSIRTGAALSVLLPRGREMSTLENDPLGIWLIMKAPDALPNSIDKGLRMTLTDPDL